MRRLANVFQGSISENSARDAEAAELTLEGEDDPLILGFKQWRSKAASADARMWAELEKEEHLEP
jgi:hypothetical protein